MGIYVTEAEIDDIMGIEPLLREFSETFPIEDPSKHYHPKAATSLMKVCMGSGCVFVAKDEDEVVGVMAGMLGLNPFTISAFDLREVCWFVKKSHRGTDAGLQLFKVYTDYAQWLLDDGQIAASFLTTLPTTPPLATKMIEQTYNLVETNYIRQQSAEAIDG